MIKKYLQWGAHRKYNEYKRTSFNLFYVFILAMSFLRKYSLFDSIVAVLAFFSTDSLGEYSNMFHLLAYLHLLKFFCTRKQSFFEGVALNN